MDNMKEAKIRKCPKCGSKPAAYEEICTTYTTWHIENGKVNRKEGIHNPGDIEKLQAVCSNLECGYVWTLRGVTQIDDMLV